MVTSGFDLRISFKSRLPPAALIISSAPQEPEEPELVKPEILLPVTAIRSMLSTSKLVDKRNCLPTSRYIPACFWSLKSSESITTLYGPPTRKPRML